mgnify:CR=1 FL=1
MLFRSHFMPAWVLYYFRRMRVFSVTERNVAEVRMLCGDEAFIFFRVCLQSAGARTSSAL